MYRADVSLQVGRSNGISNLWKRFNGNFDKLLEARLARSPVLGVPHTFLALKQGVISDIHGEDRSKIFLQEEGKSKCFEICLECYP